MNPYENLGPRYDPPPGLMLDSLRSHGVYESVRVLMDKEAKCFVVEGWGPESRQWHYCFYWAHYPKNGGPMVPRKLPDTCKPLLEWMAKIDEARFGLTPANNRKAAMREMDKSRVARMEKLKRMRGDLVKLAVDMAMHRSGLRQTFGPGYIRSRAHGTHGSDELEAAIKEYRSASSE